MQARAQLLLNAKPLRVSQTATGKVRQEITRRDRFLGLTMALAAWIGFIPALGGGETKKPDGKDPTT